MREYDEMTLKVAERVLKRSNEIIRQRERRSAFIKRLSFSASGLCAALVIGVTVWHMSESAPTLNNETDDTDIVISTETTSENNTVTTTSITTAAKTTSIHKTTVSTESTKTVSTDTTLKITESAAVSKETTAPAVTTVSSDNQIINTTVSDTVTETVSSENDVTTQQSTVPTETIQSSSTTEQESTITSKYIRTTTTTTPPHHTPAIITTTTTAVPDPDNAVEIEVKVKITVMDIDTGENIDSVGVSLFRSYSVGHRAIIQNFTIGNDTYETAPEMITLNKGDTAQFGICIGKIPPGYELVQENPDTYDYYNKYVEFSEDTAEIPEIMFYLRKIESEETVV